MYLESLVVQTKLSPLRSLKRTIARPRLTQRLLESLDYRLTLLQAGAGYGKTTALAMLAAVHQPLVWYHLEAEDTDPLIFLLTLIVSFKKTFPDVSDASLALLESWQGSGGALPIAPVIDTLINELVELAIDPTLLVIDDVHLLNHVLEATQIIERLIKHGPPALHLVLSVRYPLVLDELVGLRVTGDLLEIGESEFAFTSEEIEQLFKGQVDEPLSPEMIGQLARETEGWAIALQLIRQGLARAAPGRLTEELGQLASMKEDFFAYLAQEVLDQQPGDIRDFLLVSSVLREMTGPACDYLRDASDSARILERLLDAGLFVVEMGHSTLRYHHLFREFLHHKLPEARKREAHLRAAQYYQSRDEVEEAITHLLVAGAVDDAAVSIQQAGRTMILDGRIETLAGWIAALPPQVIADRPLLLIYQGDIARLSSRFDEALRWYERAAEICRSQGDVQGVAGALRGQARVYLDTVNPSQAEPLLREALRLSDGQEDREARARLFELLAENQLNRGRPEEAQLLHDQVHRLREEGPGEADLDARVLLRTGRLDEARRLLEERAEAERRDPVRRPRAHRETLLLLSFILSCQGDSENAYKTALEGTERGQALHSPFVTVVGTMRQGHAWLIGEAPDKFEQSQRCFERAVELSDELAVDRLKVEAYWGLCRTYGYRGELAQAEEVAHRGIEIAENAGDAWIIAMIRLSLGGANVLVGRYDEALTLLGLADVGFNECGDPFGEAAVALWRCLAWYHTNDLLRLERGMDTLLTLVDVHGYDPLLTTRTLPGPPEPRCLVPLLIFARDRGVHTAKARQILRQLGLDRVEIHPGYQLRIQTLGSFQLWRGNEEVLPGDWQRDKARQLFQLLITWRETLLDRERIWEDLWPTANPDGANRNFKVALNALYQALEPDREPGAPSAYIIRDGSLYGLRPGADVWMDSAQFERTVAQGNAEYHRMPAQSIPHYQQALALYEGDYLAEFAYEEWSGEKRRQLREFYLQAADRLARIFVDLERWDEAVEVCQAILSREVTWEQAYRLMMISYDRLGNRPQALKTYQRAVDVLRAEIDTEPAAETVALYQSIAKSAGN